MSSTTLSPYMSSREANQAQTDLELKPFSSRKEQEAIEERVREAEKLALPTLSDMYTEPWRYDGMLVWSEEGFEVSLDEHGVAVVSEGTFIEEPYLLQRFLTSAVGLEQEWKKSGLSFDEWLSEFSQQEELI